MRRLETILQRLIYCLGKEIVSPKKYVSLSVGRVSHTHNVLVRYKICKFHAKPHGMAWKKHSMKKSL